MKVSKFKDYRDDLYKAMCRDLTEFEKNFLLVSTGLLAFSITFIKDIVKVDESEGLRFLFFSWAFIIVAIFLIMWTFLKSAWESDNISNIAEGFIVANNYHDEDVNIPDADWIPIRASMTAAHNRAKRQLRRMRVFSVILFIVGISFFAYYVGSNLLRESKAQKIAETCTICHPKK